ncbi:MAG: VOC family protein [Spirochaetales bacterium]|nr:VOC family protein [Leptospiraceae bacterium]MCP5481016.1 VOC family protein [Spirochaetales bacterium]MCP5485396.1 VOC family protein [Spirochaetales bacterium]
MNPRVVGVGGIFFRAEDPEKLAAWYREHLGIAPPGGTELWESSRGIVVFAPFQKDTDYFPKEQPMMVNFRVKDIDGLLDELKGKGVRIDEKRQDEPYGRFAWIYDLEGNKIELWEPS